MIRPGRDSDAEGFIALIGACWAEYPGCILDVDRELPELRALASATARQGGALWTAERDGRVVGMVATRPMGDGAWEICRMYLDARARGAGLAQGLLGTAEAHARAQGAMRLVLWTDTRFHRAHAFYEKQSYVRSGAIRVHDDLSHSLEFRYAKPASDMAVEVLDAAAAASAERRLGEILVACVDTGASVSFLPPMPPAEARAFYGRIARDVAAGTRLLLAGWVDGALMGTVQVDCGTPPNQPHRAEIAKLLVHPDARRRGLARALMGRAEQVAREAGRSLLTLDTRADDFAEPLYRSLGWTEAGRIPGWALNADRQTTCDTIFFWKRIRDPVVHC